MSYDIYLNDQETGNAMEIEPHTFTGGTYAVGGTTQAWLNVTYNYGGVLNRVLGEKGIRIIYGKTGRDSIPILNKAIDQLSWDGDDADYWDATEGNVKRSLINLRSIAALGLDGVWDGD